MFRSIGKDCGERGIQTPGTDKPFTGFRVRPNRSLTHEEKLLQFALQFVVVVLRVGMVERKREDVILLERCVDFANHLF